MMRTSVDTAWLAGLFEGEGCLTKSGSKAQGSWRATITSTDHDVLLRVQRVASLGKIYGPNRPDQPHRKPWWVWSVGKRGEVLQLVERLHPLMCSRRAAKMDEFLAWHDAHPWQGHIAGECRRGHKLADQVPLLIHGRLTCRVCENATQRARYAARKAAI